MTLRWICSSLVAVALLCAATPARSAPGDRQYAIVASHDPSSFLKAMRAGADFVKGGRGRAFRIILAGAGVVVGIPGTTTVQRDYMRMRSGGVQIIACKESIDALSQANRRRVPVLPGISVQRCQSLRNQMNVAGWQIAPGL